MIHTATIEVGSFWTARAAIGILDPDTNHIQGIIHGDQSFEVLAIAGDQVRLGCLCEKPGCENTLVVTANYLHRGWHKAETVPQIADIAHGQKGTA